MSQSLLIIAGELTYGCCELRRAVAKRYMKPDDTLISIPTFPRLGAEPLGSTTVPDRPVHGPIHRSQSLPDETVGPHVRHIISTLNVRQRRECKVELNAPVFRDERTPQPFHDPTVLYHHDEYVHVFVNSCRPDKQPLSGSTLTAMRQISDTQKTKTFIVEQSSLTISTWIVLRTGSEAAPYRSLCNATTWTMHGTSTISSFPLDRSC